MKEVIKKKMELSSQNIRNIIQISNKIQNKTPGNYAQPCKAVLQTESACDIITPSVKM